MAEKKKTTKSTTKKTAAKVEEKPVEAVEVVEEAPKKEPKKVKIVAKDIDPYQYITVINGVHGRLIYKGLRSREKFIWDDFGYEQSMQLQELIAAKNDSRRFFEDNMFMFPEEDDWVIDYLGVRQFYENALSVDGFDDIFTKSAAQVKKIVYGLSNGQKHSVAYRASQLISEGKVDSLSVINALEEVLDIELIER